MKSDWGFRRGFLSSTIPEEEIWDYDTWHMVRLFELFTVCSSAANLLTDTGTIGPSLYQMVINVGRLCLAQW